MMIICLFDYLINTKVSVADTCAVICYPYTIYGSCNITQMSASASTYVFPITMVYNTGIGGQDDKTGNADWGFNYGFILGADEKVTIETNGQIYE